MPEAPLDLDRLLDDAITEALSHEDPDRFLSWFRTHAGDYETEVSNDALLTAPFVALLGRSIWNALPLPGNGFRPRTLPEPGRNDPCLCGSGRKFKHCCAGHPVPALDPDAILPEVLDHLDGDALANHLQRGRVAVEAVVELATRRLKRGELWNTLDLLEPLFGAEVRGRDEHYSRALDLLCDVYLELGHSHRKDALLDRLVQGIGRSPLRSDAWQRIAVSRLDRGDADGAWEAFHQARRDNPDAPGVGLLEIQLLMSRGRAEEARQRAAFWEKRLQKRGHGGDHRLVDFFSRVSRDPHEVMSDMGIKAAAGAGGRLLAWLPGAAARPVPSYRVAPPPGQGAAPGRALVTPEGLAAVEARWGEVFPATEPSPDEGVPQCMDDPWAPHREQAWMDFLTAHPEAADSLAIVDDLMTALSTHPQYGADWLDHALVEPLLARAEAIIEKALSGVTRPGFSRSVPENRPALRILARRVDLELRRGNEAAAARAAEHLSALDPEYDHTSRRDGDRP